MLVGILIIIVFCVLVGLMRIQHDTSEEGESILTGTSASLQPEVNNHWQETMNQSVLRVEDETLFYITTCRQWESGYGGYFPLPCDNYDWKITLYFNNFTRVIKYVWLFFTLKLTLFWHKNIWPQRNQSLSSKWEEKYETNKHTYMIHDDTTVVFRRNIGQQLLLLCVC